LAPYVQKITPKPVEKFEPVPSQPIDIPEREVKTEFAEKSPVSDQVETMVINLADLKAEQQFPTTDLDDSMLVSKTSLSSIGLRRKSTQSFDPMLRGQMSMEIGKVSNIREEEEQDIVMVTEMVKSKEPLLKKPPNVEIEKRLEIDTTTLSPQPHSLVTPISTNSGHSYDTIGPLPVIKKTRVEFDETKSRNSFSIMPDRSRESMFHKDAKRAQSMDVPRLTQGTYN
jgi:hypothetical protein